MPLVGIREISLIRLTNGSPSLRGWSFAHHTPFFKSHLHILKYGVMEPVRVEIPLTQMLEGIERARKGTAQTRRQLAREAELRVCLQQIEIQRASQIAACQAFAAHATAEIDRLQGLRADVQKRIVGLDEMYALAAEQLVNAYLQSSSVGGADLEP
jgi:hypothetical protein